MSMLNPTFIHSRFFRLVFAVGLIGLLGLVYHQTYGLPENIRLPFYPPSSPVESKPAPPTEHAEQEQELPLPPAGQRLDPPKPTLSTEPHPIDELVRRADSDFATLLSKRTEGVAAAAEAYRIRRERHPPPHFDQWVSFAEKNNAVVIEDLFDQIYHDITPFWALPPAQIRTAASSWQFVISVRNGKVTKQSDDRPWLDLWYDMFQHIEGYLPDVDLAVNEMDESRLLVPWQKINHYVNVANSRKNTTIISADSSIATDFTRLEAFSRSDYSHPWNIHGPYWDMAREACPPDTEGHDALTDANYNKPPVFPSGWPAATYHGYVLNWTVAKDPCRHPHLRNLHGTFVEPISISTSTELFPMFGGSKLPQNNEILLPAPMYWTDDEFYSGGNRFVPWKDKTDTVIWRGAASGGRNRIENWTHFQRHRFLSMLNGTQIRTLQEHPLPKSWPLEEGLVRAPLPPESPDEMFKPRNFPLPDLNTYPLAADHQPGALAEWVDSFSDAAFVNLLCFPEEPEHSPRCSYTDPWYEVTEPLPMGRQYDFKYLPDIDGNSFSGRYRGFLRSHSLPIKATIYSEWHDDRLVPWKHFVPMDNTFVDFYGIMEYFLGYNSSSGGSEGRAVEGMASHDEAAEKIAEEGREWAEKVLRKEDMLVYVYRLVLEYARICDERREELGFVGDLV